MKMNVELISDVIIKPSQPTPSNLLYLKTSLLDHVNGPVLMPLIFFYAKRHTYATQTILDRLKYSLPATLSVFYPLAGRVQDDANYIVCNDGGVPYVEAKVHSTCLSEIVYKADVSVLDTLLPYHDNDETHSKLILAIQVTTFACGGLTIGIKMSHAISDAFSVAMFVKNWSAMANGDTHALLTRPYFEIWKQFPPNKPENSTNNSTRIESRPVTKWFVFSKEKCEALRDKHCSEYNSQNMPTLTMILSAFIWSRVTISSRSDVKCIPHQVYHAVNLRPKVKTPTQSCYYFGNMSVNAVTVLNHHGEHTLLGDSFFAGMEKSIDKIIGKDGFFIEEMRNGKEELRFVTEYFEKLARGEIVPLGFSTLRSLPMYESDFGWGRPVWVTSATLVFKDIVIMIPGGSTSEDTYAYVNLSHGDMAKLENDHEFVSFVSKSPNFVTSKL